MKLQKIKRPAGVFSYEVELLVEDEFGVWLFAKRGSNWAAPHDAGTLPIDCLLLLSPDRHWVAWWVDDPVDRRVEIDICLQPTRDYDGWSFVDLELDPIRHQNGSIEVEDHDEFEAACREGWISPGEAEVAQVAAAFMEAALRRADEPYRNEGWRRLDNARLANG